MTYASIKVETTQQFDTFKLDVGLELDLGKGIIGLFGQTGAGKSSLLKAIAGLPHKGHSDVWIDQGKVDKKADLNPCVYQSQYPSLLPNMSVLANLKLVQQHSAWGGKNGLSFEQVTTLCGINEFLPKRVAELSGGQQQMVSFARTLLSGKSIVLLDEPFSAMDWQVRRRKLQLLKTLNRDLGLKFVLVSHQLDELAWVCDHIVALKQGQLLLNGEPEQVLPQLQNADDVVKFSRLNLYFDQALAEHGLIKWRLGESEGSETLFTHSIEQAPKQVALLEANKIVLTAHASEDGDCSAVNQVATKIIEMKRHDRRVTLTLEVEQQQMLAEISEYSCDKMNLQIGQSVMAQFKSI